MWIIGAAALAAVALLLASLRRWLVAVDVEGISMSPTVEPGDRVIVRQAAVDAVRAGQLVVVERPRRDGGWAWPPLARRITDREWMIKRAVAVPGDAVPPDVAVQAPRLAGPAVPPGCLLVLGDNTEASVDSREIGYIPAERLLGVVCWLRRRGVAAARSRA
jgi:signal peptidase I